MIGQITLWGFVFLYLLFVCLFNIPKTFHHQFVFQQRTTTDKQWFAFMRLFNHFVILYLLFVCLCNVAKSFPTSICISTQSNKEQRLTNNGSSLWDSLILINRPPPYFLPMICKIIEFKIFSWHIWLLTIFQVRS